jgi:hypothetical protein
LMMGMAEAFVTAPGAPMMRSAQGDIARARLSVRDAHLASRVLPSATGRAMRAHAAGALRMHWGQAVDGTVLIAGVDRASSAVAMPNYDGFYFAGVLLCVVGAGLLQYQSYGGKVGLGKYLSTGPEDKNWETRQARKAMERDLEMKKANEGSWLANILPKLDFVEVYGQEKPRGAEGMNQSSSDNSTAKEGNAISEVQMLTEQMAAAVEKQDYASAAEIKQKLKEVLEDRS